MSRVMPQFSRSRVNTNCRPSDTVYLARALFLNPVSIQLDGAHAAGKLGTKTRIEIGSRFFCPFIPCCHTVLSKYR